MLSTNNAYGIDMAKSGIFLDCFVLPLTLYPGGGVETEVIKERLYLMLRDGGGGPQPGVPHSVQPLCGLPVHNDSSRHYYDDMACWPGVPPWPGSHSGLDCYELILQSVSAHCGSTTTLRRHRPDFLLSVAASWPSVAMTSAHTQASQSVPALYTNILQHYFYFSHSQTSHGASPDFTTQLFRYND